MVNFILGAILGASLAGMGVVYSQSGITSPYDSSQLMGQTNLYNAIISIQAEQRRQQDRMNDADGLANWRGIELGGDRPCR